MGKTIKIILVLVVVISCQDDNPVSPIKETSIIPLNVGNQWLGKVERINNNVEVISTFFNGISIVGETILDSTRIAIIQLENGIKFNCENTDSGFVFNNNGSKSLQYKFPANNGDKYRVGDNAVREIKSIDTLIITEYGEFSCVHYSLNRDDSESHTEEFLSPNYGFIYKEHYQIDGPTPEIFLYSRIFYNPKLCVDNKK